MRACVRRRPDAVGGTRVDRDPFCSLELSGVELSGYSSLDESRLSRDRDGPDPPSPHS